MSKRRISTINGVEIFAEITSNGNVFVPIKPICTALGVADNKQREKILEDDILLSWNPQGLNWCRRKAV